ncbi:MAG TPA: hypothetical protein VED01_12820 [Burkholderiales bacterium]|nr:hypothetical protein [Burkholderiales bacterium]
MKKAVRLAAVVLAVSARAIAAPHEIEIETDDIAGVREQALALHANVGRPGRNDVDREHRIIRVMPEYAYGFSHHWQVALQLPASRIAGDLEANGARAEVKYVAPHNDARGPYWGAAAKISYSHALPDQGLWGLELTPIVGARIGDWHFAVNAGLSLRLSGTQREVEFAPAAMAMFELNERHQVGLEYYGSLGPIKRFLPREERGHVLFAAWNYDAGALGLNVGVGRGFTDSSDSWVAKMILGMKLK